MYFELKMSVESLSPAARREQGYLDYLAYERFNEGRRRDRQRTLGGAAVATRLLLAPIDLTVASAEMPTEVYVPPAAEVEAGQEMAEVVDLGELRRKKLGGFAHERAELGYADTAAA